MVSPCRAYNYNMRSRERNSPAATRRHRLHRLRPPSVNTRPTLSREASRDWIHHARAHVKHIPPPTAPPVSHDVPSTCTPTLSTEALRNYDTHAHVKHAPKEAAPPKCTLSTEASRDCIRAHMPHNRQNPPKSPSLQRAPPPCRRKPRGTCGAARPPSGRPAGRACRAPRGRPRRRSPGSARW